MYLRFFVVQIDDGSDPGSLPGDVAVVGVAAHTGIYHRGAWWMECFSVSWERACIRWTVVVAKNTQQINCASEVLPCDKYSAPPRITEFYRLSTNLS